MNKFFQSVSSDLLRPDIDMLPPRVINALISAEFIIAVLEIEKQLMNLDISKAPGPDDVPTWVLKDWCGYLAGPVCSIYNSSIREGHLPIIWKAVTTHPIPKVLPPKAIETDLRPTSLTSILGNELETHVVKWPAKDCPFQFGSIAKCSTVH